MKRSKQEAFNTAQPVTILAASLTTLRFNAPMGSGGCEWVKELLVQPGLVL